MTHPARFAPRGLSATDEQRDVQTAMDRTMIVQANAGAAKTTTLALRIGEALARGIPPEKILALTYTAPARQALTQALARIGLVATLVKRLRILTFDDFAARILLSVEGRAVPARLTPEVQAPSVWQAMEQLELDADQGIVERFLNASHRLKGTLARDLLVWEGERITPDLAEDLGVEHHLLRLFTAYEDIRYPGGDRSDRPVFRGEFDATYDLARLLADPDTPTPLHEIPAWPRDLEEVMVDEMHDLNFAMFTILKAVLQTRPSRFCGVGDFDQVIHAMAGAERRFMDRDVDFGQGRHVVLYPLTASRRFGPRLAALAGQLTGKAYASDSSHHTTVRCLAYGPSPDLDCEAQVVATVRQWKAQQEGQVAGLAVLLRHPCQSVLLENALLQADMAYETVGFTSYLMQPEVLLVRALLAVATEDYEQLDAESTRRELVRAVVFFCGVTLGHQDSESESPEERLQHAVAAIAADASSLRPFFEYQVLQNGEPAMTQRLRRAIDVARTASGPDMFDRFLDALEIEAWVRNVFVEKQRRADAVAYLQGLRQAARRFATAKAFFSHLNQAEAQLTRSTHSPHKNALLAARLKKSTLTLATITAVKGLEFEHVVLPYLARGQFPAALASSDAEERNLFYVGMTRARQALTLLADRAQPSEFLGRMGLSVA